MTTKTYYTLVGTEKDAQRQFNTDSATATMRGINDVFKLVGIEEFLSVTVEKALADKNPTEAATVAKITIEVLPEVYPATEDEDND